MTKMTTIKVPQTLRQRVAQHAQRAHTSQAAVLEQALGLLDREEFFTQLREDVAQRHEDDTDRAERETWLAGPIVTAETAR